MIEVPVPAEAPPQLPEYQFHDAPVPSVPPVNVKVELPFSHTVPGLA